MESTSPPSRGCGRRFCRRFAPSVEVRFVGFLYACRSWVQSARFIEHPFGFGITIQCVVSVAEVECEIFVERRKRAAFPKGLERGLIERFAGDRISHSV